MPADWLQDDENNIAEGLSNSLLISLSIFGFVFVLIVVVLICYAALNSCKAQLNSCFTSLRIKIRDQVFYSAIYQYLIVSNLKLAYDSVFYLYYFGSTESTIGWITSSARCGIIFILVIWIIWSAIWLNINRHRLYDKVFYRKHGSIYHENETEFFPTKA